MKYIVKNCPSVCFGELCRKPFLSYVLKCADCTDCVIKQVVEKCKDMASDRDYYAYDFAKEILQLFDIEEINK